MIKKFIRFCKNYQAAELQRKQAFLFEKTKEHYFNELLKQNQQGIKIPEIVAVDNLKKLAYVLAAKELRKVVAECRVNECYKNCVKYHRGLAVNA